MESINTKTSIVDTPPPCDTCTLWDTCEKFELACKPFVLYVIRGGEPQGERRPDKDYFNMVYHPDIFKNSRKKKRMEMKKARSNESLDDAANERELNRFAKWMIGKL